MKTHSLRQYADTIPSMGGSHIADELMHLAANVPPHAAIVEVGAWLGSATAYLALGSHVPIHVYDWFTVHGSELKKAKNQGVELPSAGSDTLDIVEYSLSPFNADIHFHKGDIRESTWTGEPIGLYVDDVSKRPELWEHVVDTFFPHLIDGAVIVLMDYNFHHRTGDPMHATQYEYISQRSEFEPLSGWDHLEIERAFRYRRQS